ncbi:succinate dehydrogenase, cytochrome b556 subunit [Candidatus Blochmanniella camponoti]|uniref:Succinate dehydrogenase cytochrome b556 subunit n=1 Tax=Candidatus Blochmanniella camponoti TaxID=108080 RepID=A0ABY4SRW4_9ENTR|nr:succinate dehydrogenase, cytochrome b556 subunit [Candidatus Blochmannia herculeanus]URJ24737.1 succinate dehydrogenase, cytochrome b556 subunit [Candidatus Blochmannia herculeanus]URJ27205.1 succinate dehydrogenase, cytochrome b556 subunit [Candidatus Blochmannia herculeanus]
MIKKNQRPIYLNIRTIRFPITAIASILHRISGILLFITIGPILWMLKLSLSSNNEFCKIHRFLLMNHYIFQFMFWIVTILLSYHIFAGIRQILMDFGCLNQTLLIGKISAKIIFVLTILLSIFIGILIWYPLNQS